MNTPKKMQNNNNIKESIRQIIFGLPYFYKTKGEL